MEIENKDYTQQDLDELRKSLDGVFDEATVNDIISKAEKKMKKNIMPEMDDEMKKAYGEMKSKMDGMKEKMGMMSKAMDLYKGMEDKMGMMNKAMDGEEMDDDMTKAMDDMEKAMTEFNDMYGSLAGTPKHGDDLKKSLEEEALEKPVFNAEAVADEITKSIDFEALTKEAIGKSLGEGFGEKLEGIQKSLTDNLALNQGIQKSLEDFGNSPFGKMKALHSDSFMDRGDEKGQDGKTIVKSTDKGRLVDELEKAIGSEGIEGADKTMLQNATMTLVASNTLPAEAKKLLQEMNGITIG